MEVMAQQTESCAVMDDVDFVDSEFFGAEEAEDEMDFDIEDF